MVTQEQRVYAAISYLGPAVLLPLILKRQDTFVFYHIKQGLALLLFMVCTAILSIMPALGVIILSLGSMTATVLIILGVINATRGKTRKLPFIGNYGEEIHF